jgi:uncharacterized protein
MPHHHFHYQSHIPVSAQALWDWHMKPEAFARLTPWWSPAQVINRSPEGLLQDGTSVTLRVWMGPIPVLWVANHCEFHPIQSFVDQQYSGPFKFWKHTHQFTPDMSSENASTHYTDHIEYELPVTRWMDRPAHAFLSIHLNLLFSHRHRVVAQIFSSPQP